ncbi:HU family DNA-binding protein [Lutibacter aestuarii]|uniref:HU family DNA-binding protein n=1 Tax=Lutibacter aestuarii TaxID=861111 RepID=A0ABW2Z7X4_9FLAO|nr:HU family DNA-binding protein [uncultured Lutibacter sp.]
MPIRYRITKRSNTIANNKAPQYIMQAVSTGVVDLDQISYQISNECTLSKVDVKMVLYALGEKLQFHLEDGKIVDLENIGKFKIGFKCKADPNPANLTPKRNIQKYHLNFQPSVVLKRWLKRGITTYKEGSRSK